MTSAGDRAAGVRRAEIVMALSHATDLAIGQPVEYALASCALAMRLGAALGHDEPVLREIYHHALLRYIGCNAETDAMAALFGDEIEFRRGIATLDMGDPRDLAPALLRAIAGAQAGQPLPTMIWRVIQGVAASRSLTVQGFTAHCETAQRLARRLGFDEAIVRNLGQFQERWDGAGLPGGLAGVAIAPAVRAVVLAHDVVVIERTEGRAAALAAVERRSGGLYDPRVAQAFLQSSDALLDDLAAHASWDAVLALEPDPQVQLTEAQLDEACVAMADFVDLKSPFTAGHSRRVAELAASAGRLAGLPPPDVTALRRAALVHDIGQAGVSSGLFAKPGALTDAEREQVRLHPYHGERILARPPALARLAAIVSHHHERSDGSGYHRGARADATSPAARILAAAEVYQARIEERPHRAAATPAEAAAALRREVREGTLDGDAVTAILEAAGHRVPRVRRERVGGLTAREVEVLRLLVQGLTTKAIAQALGISAKTADNHIQSVYSKTGVRTRAGVTLFAIEHGLTEPA